MNAKDQQALLAKTYGPPPLIYCDNEALYLEFPTYVLRFDFTEGGLSKALKHVPRIAGRTAPKPTGASNFASAKPVDTMKNVKKPPTARVAKATAAKRELNGFSEKTKAAAADIIRKLGTGER